MQRRGEGVVEIGQRFAAGERFGVEIKRTRFGNQRVEEIAGVEQAGGAFVETGAGGGEIDRRRHHGRGAGQGAAALFAQIFGQRIATERHAGSIHRVVARRQRLQHKFDFAAVARVVIHRRGVGHAAAAAKMRHHAVPAVCGHRMHQRSGIMAAAAAFQAVKQHQQRRIGAGAVDKIISHQRLAGAVGQKLAPISRRRRLQRFGIKGFDIAAAQPAWGVQRGKGGYDWHGG